MRNFFTITLLFVYLFSLIGYSYFFDYFINRAERQTEQQLDIGEYDESELFEIKIPLDLPYFTGRNEYERFDGTIELNGIHYNFVKRKVVNDTLHLLCLPNQIQTALYKAKNEFAAKGGLNVPSSSSKKGIDSFGKKGVIETDQDNFTFRYASVIISSNSYSKNISSSLLTPGFLTSLTKPPEFI